MSYHCILYLCWLIGMSIMNIILNYEFSHSNKLEIIRKMFSCCCYSTLPAFKYCTLILLYFRIAVKCYFVFTTVNWVHYT